MSSQSRVPAGVPTGGQYSISARAEAAVTLDDVLPTRQELLDSPELRFLPAEWTAPYSDEYLAEVIADMRARKEALAAEQAEQAEADETERARRRRYRRPDWLAKDGEDYTTEDGFHGSKVTDAIDGMMLTRYLVRGPDGTETEVGRVEEMADWIVEQRAAAAKNRPLTLADCQFAKTADHDPEPGLGGASWSVTGPGGEDLGRVESTWNRTNGLHWVARDTDGGLLRYPDLPDGRRRPERSFETRALATTGLLHRREQTRQQPLGGPVAPSTDPAAGPFARALTLKDLEEHYEGLVSPENISWDGERPAADTERAHSQIVAAYWVRRREIDPRDENAYCLGCRSITALNTETGRPAPHDVDGRQCWGSR